MADTYAPDLDAIPKFPYGTVYLSERDLGLNVPINYVIHPGVSLTAACFSHRLYEDVTFGDCLSNLLVAGFRRLELDLYWDQGRQTWSFCPCQIPSSIPNAEPSSATAVASSGTSSGVAISSGVLTARQVAGSASSQTSAVTSGSSSSTSSSSSNASTSIDSVMGTTVPTLVTLPDTPPGEQVVAIGPYTCTSSIGLSPLLSILWSHIQQTENTLGAHLIYVVINLHAGANATSPTSPASEPTSLPASSNLLGSLFSSNLSAYTYTPSNLFSDRSNLNSSWYVVSELYRPVDGYYSTSMDSNNVVSTEDGWPSESYIEFTKSKRLLLQWGSIDPQMNSYNFSADESFIFQSGYILNNTTNITANESGAIVQGCQYIDSSTNISSINSSWLAIGSVPGFDYSTASTTDLTATFNLVSNLTSCGISSILNTTLLNATAHENYVPYQNYSYSTVWSWAPGQPANYTPADQGSDTLFRCASADDGGWVVSDCSQKYFAACQAIDQPYNWSITTYEISYSFAPAACDKGYTFAAPRTALENSFLMQAKRTATRDYGGNGIWVDFNELDVKECWVTGGSNATCPYSSVNLTDSLRARTILIPTVAAILVLIVSALTVFSKMAGNRQVRKRTRRRANNGFVYEGVPS